MILHAVLDSCSLKSLLRRPKNTIKYNQNTVLDDYIRKGNIIIYLDEKGSVISEWSEGNNIEIIKNLLNAWQPYGGIQTVSAKKIPYQQKKQLRIYGFTHTGDKLMVRVALAIPKADKSIISEDHGFWDPSDVRSKGDNNARVAKLLSSEFGITVYLLGIAIRKLRSNAK